MRSLSVVIPILDEEPTLRKLHAELRAMAAREPCDLQMVMVDDGSRDGSWQVICDLAAQDPALTGIRLRRNFGKAAALSAGFDAATGDVIVTIDADMQDCPSQIPKLLAKLDEGFDVVSGWKVDRRDPWHKRYPSLAFNWLVGRLTGLKLHDHNCGLKCFRRDVIHEIRLYGELHRFVPVLAAARGFRVGEVPVEHLPRRFGHSKYGWSRLPKGFLDLFTVQFITRFGRRPQHWLGSIGLASLTIGLLGMTYLAVAWLYSRRPGHASDEVLHLHETAAMYYSLVAVLLGGQFLAIGFVAEMIAALVARERDEFSIAEYSGPQPAAADVTESAPLPTQPAAPHWSHSGQRVRESEGR